MKVNKSQKLTRFFTLSAILILYLVIIYILWYLFFTLSLWFFLYTWNFFACNNIEAWKCYEWTWVILSVIFSWLIVFLLWKYTFKFLQIWINEILSIKFIKK